MGIVICLEGLNGCGKETQLWPLAQRLYNYSRDILLTITREPNRINAAGDAARDALSTANSPEEKGYLLAQNMTTNRGEHDAQLVAPNSALSYMVTIKDRSYPSTFAFQGAQGVPFEDILALQKQNNVHVHDLTIIYDVTPEEAATRISLDASRSERRTFDGKIAFNHNVREIYLSLPMRLAGWDDNIVVVNAMRPAQEVHEETWSLVKNCLEKRL